MNAKKKVVLFVTRDKKPGMIATRIARVLQAQGAEIRVVAEGLSVAEWKSAGFDNCIVSEGPLDIKEPWGMSPSLIIKAYRPDIAVIGLSSPIRSEEMFEREVIRSPHYRDEQLHLVALDDNWGSVNRCSVRADLVLTCDALGKRLVHQHELYKNHTDEKVVIIGDLSATAATEPIPQATIDAFNAAKGDAEYAFILASQKWPESDDIISIGSHSCLASLDAGSRLVVIPRFHPGAKPKDKERWQLGMQEIIFGEFGEKYVGVIQEIDARHNTDHLATLADGVFAATGSALRAAAFAGKIPLCVWTPALAEKLKAESGMEHHSLVLGGAALELAMSEDIVALIKECNDVVLAKQEELLTPIPFDAEKATNAILAIAK
ncbi:MAG: hypothetical protein UX81_C0004G0049 [Parcubacteria group bacterium GW2011_GWA2_47_12]|nr:MAG: hypothetical protein UX81_C0004G0049 [Parcubacteria group bacterium GW2011_GWA2_47_12]